MKIRNIEKARVICLSSIISEHLPEIVPDITHTRHTRHTSHDGGHPDPRPAAAGRPGRRPPRLLRHLGGVQAELRQAVRQRRGGGHTVKSVYRAIYNSPHLVESTSCYFQTSESTY